ncbi:hypothetical protein B0H34DRAFT_631811, partial [Crassisporium funariophilum]
GFMQKATSNKEKADTLAKTFFLAKPNISSVPPKHMYLGPLLEHPLILLDQIQQTIRQLSSYKANSPNNIPNIVLQKSLDLIKNHLLQLFRAVFKLNIYYNRWKEFTTVVLRKPGKPRYNTLKAYWPITLLCTITKVLTAIVAEDMARLIETKNLLPANHYRG